MNYLLQCFFIVLPLLIAGLIFIFFLKYKYLQIFNKPIDMHMNFYGKRLFGDNKTFRGFFIMPIATVLAVMVISLLFKIFDVDEETILFDYNFSGSYKALIYGAAYVCGELPNSFVKRRLNINPGERADQKHMRIFFDIMDKIDSLIACGFVAFFVYGIDSQFIFGAIALGVFLHYLTDVMMVKMRLKKY